MKRDTMLEIISGLLILLFVYAGASKLLDYEKFSVELGKSPLLTSFASWIAVAIPITEVLVAIMLAWTRYRLAGLFASFTLMMMFTAYIIVILQFSDYIPCSCGGILQNMSWTQHLLFNIIFIVIALAGILFYPGKQEMINPLSTKHAD